MTPNNSIVTNLRRALRFVWESGASWTLASICLVALQGLLPLLVLYLMKMVVDAVTTSMTALDAEVAFQQVAIWVGFLCAVTVVEILLTSATRFVSTMHAQIVTDHMFDILHAKSVEVDLEYYENPQYYDTLHRAQTEAPYRPTRILNGFKQVGQNAISLLAVAGLLYWFHWSIVVVLLTVAIPGVLVRLRYANKTYSWRRGRTPAERQSRYLNFMLTRDSHAKEIRLFGLGSLLTHRFRNVRKLLRQEQLNLETKRSVAESMTQLVPAVAVFGLLLFLAYRTMQGILTLGDLVMYFGAIQRGRGYLQGVLTSLTNLYEDNLFLSNLFEFLDLKPKVVEPLVSKPVSQSLTTGIVFDHVSFQYNAGNKKVLDSITMRIRPGEHVAFVGENGAGKTTLIKLLCRLYDPTEGTIIVDGTDIRHFSTADFRRQISVIFQDYTRYHLTAQENIWFGNTTLPSDHKLIEQAARQAGIHDVIARMKSGYETTLGTWFEDGQDLSIGEWQKIALARAFLRQAQIIILDEPTSSLDAVAEYKFFNNFHQLAKGRTVILISHRFSTVKMADRIYMIEDGGIVESGNHDELIFQDGRYARMFETQAQYYR